MPSPPPEKIEKSGLEISETIARVILVAQITAKSKTESGVVVKSELKGALRRK
jgi:hypothetical protein